MAQVQKKFIANDAVDGTKILLLNDQALRGLNFASSPIDILKVNVSDQIEISHDVLMSTAAMLHMGSGSNIIFDAAGAQINAASDLTINSTSNMVLAGVSAADIASSFSALNSNGKGGTLSISGTGTASAMSLLDDDSQGLSTSHTNGNNFSVSLADAAGQALTLSKAGANTANLSLAAVFGSLIFDKTNNSNNTITLTDGTSSIALNRVSSTQYDINLATGSVSLDLQGHSATPSAQEVTLGRNSDNQLAVGSLDNGMSGFSEKEIKLSAQDAGGAGNFSTIDANNDIGVGPKQVIISAQDVVGTGSVSTLQVGQNGQIVLSANDATNPALGLSMSSGKFNFTGGNLDLGGKQAKNAADPTAAQDLVTLSYMQALLQGLKPKQAVRAGSVANLNLASMPAAIDGVTMTSGDRFLAKDQTLPQANGIYIFNGAASAATRATDMDSMSPVDEINGAYTFIQSGTQAGQGWVEQSVVVTLGTSPMNWVWFNSAASITGGDMITVSSNVVSVDLATVSGLQSTNPGNPAGQLQIKLEASNPSLQIDGSNQLGLKIDPAGALQKGASGTSVKVDAATVKINGSDQLESLKPAFEQYTLSGTDITNQYKDGAHPAYASGERMAVVGAPEQSLGSDYSVSATGGSGGVVRYTFLGDLATGGPSALVAGDKIILQYSYL